MTELMPLHDRARHRGGRPDLTMLKLAAAAVLARYQGRPTTVYDQRRQTFDRHAAYVVVAFVAGG